VAQYMTQKKYCEEIVQPCVNMNFNAFKKMCFDYDKAYRNWPQIILKAYTAEAVRSNLYNLNATRIYNIQKKCHVVPTEEEEKVEEVAATDISFDAVEVKGVIVV
jgi:hypothetical protein